MTNKQDVFNHLATAILVIIKKYKQNINPQQFVREYYVMKFICIPCDVSSRYLPINPSENETFISVQ